jgi:hypothetical protein
MRPEDSGSAAPGAAHRPGDMPWPGAARPPGDWPGGDWPDEADDDQAGPPPWPAAARAHGPGGQPGRRYRRPLALTAVAVAALALGAGAAAAVIQGLPAASPPAASSASPPGSAAPGSVIPGGSSGTARLFMAGRVLAVTPTSITIGGAAHRVTAAVTAATRVTGQATSIRSVKVGDHVSAQITERGGRATATSIQDPARLP